MLAQWEYFGASKCATGTGHFQEFRNLEKHKVVMRTFWTNLHMHVYVYIYMHIYTRIYDSIYKMMIHIFIYIYIQGSSRFVSPKRSLAFPQFAVAFGKLFSALTVNLLGVKGVIRWVSSVITNIQTRVMVRINFKQVMDIVGPKIFIYDQYIPWYNIWGKRFVSGSGTLPVLLWQLDSDKMDLIGVHGIGKGEIF